MDKHFLVFHRHAHPVVFFVRAETTTEAIWHFIGEECPQTARHADNTLAMDADETLHWYPHPLAYIEAIFKTDGEWQIRELPDWTWQDDFGEIFCGESEDGPPAVIAECRVPFAQELPDVEAEAFVWYLKAGTLVTFYQRETYKIKVLKRYVWNWDGTEVTIKEWDGDHEAIITALSLVPPRYRTYWPKTSQA